MKRVLFLLFAVAFTVFWSVGVLADKATVERADKLFTEKNYKEAAEAYQGVLDGEPGEAVHHASQRLVACRLRLQLFDDALEAAEAYVERTKGTPWEARAERLAGNLYMTIPHWGTRSGGDFHRNQWGQGIQVHSYKYDKKRALAHLERARELYADYDLEERVADLSALPEGERKSWHDERILCNFDLAGVYGRFGIYENTYFFWYGFWGERDDFLAGTAGEDDFDEYHSYWELQRKRPIGLRLGPDGEPIFPTRPKSYEGDLDDDQRILYLLHEIRELDETEKRQHTAMSYYRQAMLAQSRFGMSRLGQYAGNYWYGNGYPLQEELKERKPWELGDHEALVLAGGSIRKVTLPDQWDVLGLLRVVRGDYSASAIADQAAYSIGLHHQARQQYVTAIGEYEAAMKGWPKSVWSTHARSQIEKIRASQVQLSQTGVQLPGEPARLQMSYRNTDRIHFTARRIDHEGFLSEIRNEEIDKDKGFRHQWNLNQWHAVFVQGWNERSSIHRVAEKYVGEEVARWSDAVEDDGTHRYARATLQTPLDQPGAYLVHAYLTEPPEGDADESGRSALGLGASRAVVVITDLALVEKKTRGGNLYFVCDARSGAPVPNASVKVLEWWSTWNNREKKSEYFKETHELTTDEVGLAELKRSRHGGNLHVMVRAGEGDASRVAWSGMTYWSHYQPSTMQDGRVAYCITDRPVYRPGQTVRYKVWLRDMKKGIYENAPNRPVLVTVHDFRGNKIHEVRERTDPFGGVDGSLVLGEEPPLGIYRIQVHGARYAGGVNFRVEEYKKPEFEVTVEPGETHTKLGGKLTAKIRATYYFGGPVTDATVQYKVFREEYRHRYYHPGYWDWLYGPGYGLVWYDYDWFPWWRWVSCCRVAPPWWWGWYGYSAHQPVRELVKQGEARIGHDGALEVEIDTAAAKRDHPDRDHRYVITAEVRDSSRRVIAGEGAVKVTRQAYYAVVQADRGYYRPGEEMTIRVRCLTPDNAPVKTAGIVTVSEVVYGGMDNAEMKETELDRWQAETSEDGSLRIQLRHEKSGLLRIGFEAPDRWGGVVKGFGLVWVAGRDFEGKLYRFNDLEIVTDKRTYEPGETAHVMINTKRADSYVLFSDEVDNNHLLSWKMLHLPNRHTVVDIPIEKGDGPNFFLEATTVADTRVHQQVKRICVPPEEGVLNVSVAADKPEYGPGDTAEVTVTAKTLDGEPANAQVTVNAFDKSVLYIQPEMTPAIAMHFHGGVRQHGLAMTTNLVEQFAAWGHVARPYQELYPVPAGWWGVWGPTVGDWRQVGDRDLGLMSGRLGEDKSVGDSYGIGGGAGGGFRPGAAEAAGGGGAPPPASPGGPAGGAARSKAGFRGAEGEVPPGTRDPNDPVPPDLVEAEVRKTFADTAFWATTLETGEDGETKATFELPENLTTWKINAFAMTKETKVGQADTSVVTTKNLLVRLQAPRFFLEYDEVVVSANVHNYLATEKGARVSLAFPEELMKLIGDTPAEIDVTVPAGGETRVDWRVKVLSEGTAELLVKALTDEESDAMQMTFPVLVHGMTKQVATTGSMRPGDVEKTVTVEIDVPEKRRPELTRLEVQYAPSLVGSMLDALPYCLRYPYGCTEQTVSRFLPAVLTLKTLTNMGIRLEDVRKIRNGRMEELRRIEKGEKIGYWSCYVDSPIFDESEMQRLIQRGLSRIESMQNGDGGWGWWKQDTSSPYLTSYVLYALFTAREGDVAVSQNMLGHGVAYLRNREQQDLTNQHWSVGEGHAFSAYVLSLAKVRAAISPGEGDERPGDLVERLWEGRDSLNLYGKALLSLAMANLGEDRSKTVLRNIMQYVEENEETQVAWFRTAGAGWWYWWNNDIETNAWILRAIVRHEPKSDVAPRLVKWLLNNRRNGFYWRSTRDTTLCVAAMSDFVAASGEGTPDYTLRFDFDDGAVVKEVAINRDNFFTYDNRFILEGVSLGSGKHTLKITKTGPGALYFNTYLSYFTKEEHITAAGHELKVERQYFMLKQIEYEVEVEGSEGQPVKEKRLRYERIPVNDGDSVKSGDVIQVELKVTSDNDYTYLAFEDMKPAGCEPVDVRSGGKTQEGFVTYMELRDEKTVFFMGHIEQGSHLLRYRLRAEVPGVFHALPAKLFAMYVPELKANSEECLIRILDD